MTISFKKTKENKVYADFVQNPSDRSAMRAFNKLYSSQIAGDAVKLHQRMLSYSSAGAYNKDYGKTDNRIELKKGTKDKSPLVFKVRVSGSWRKFFYQVIDGDSLLTKDWMGDFEGVSEIEVITVNNHDYAAV